MWGVPLCASRMTDTGLQSLRATRLKHTELRELPPIRVTVVSGENEVTIRVSDQGMETHHFLYTNSNCTSAIGGGLLTPEIKNPVDLFSFSHLRNPARMDVQRLGALRTISSSQTGMVATVEEQVRRWSADVADEDPQGEAGVSPHPRIGIGLPMSNIFATYGALPLRTYFSLTGLARYFGGSLELVSLDGYGALPRCFWSYLALTHMGIARN